MQKDVTIYTSHGCVPCMMTKSWFKEKKISYEERRVGKDKNILKELILLDQTVTPVVVINEQVIAGFQPKEFSKALELS